MTILSDGARAWEPPELGGRQPAPVPAAPAPEADRAAARAAGYEAGYAEGLGAGRARAEAIVAELSSVLGSLARPVAEQEAVLLRDMTALATAVAEAVTRRALARDGGDIEAVLREALALLPRDEDDLVVEVNPADGELVRAHLQAQRDGDGWRLVDVPSLARGGLRVRTPSSYIDASAERALAELLEHLQLAAEHASPPEPP